MLTAVLAASPRSPSLVLLLSTSSYPKRGLPAHRPDPASPLLLLFTICGQGKTRIFWRAGDWKFSKYEGTTRTEFRSRDWVPSFAFFSPTLFSSPPSLVRYPVHTFAIERPPPAGNGIFGVETSLAESGSAAPPTVDYIGPLAARGEKNLAKGERDKASSSH